MNLFWEIEVCIHKSVELSKSNYKFIAFGVIAFVVEDKNLFSADSADASEVILKFYLRHLTSIKKSAQACKIQVGVDLSQ